MSDIYTSLLLAFVSLTSIWSLICLRKPASGKVGSGNRAQSATVFSKSLVTAKGMLSMTPPLEQLKAADF